MNRKQKIIFYFIEQLNRTTIWLYVKVRIGKSLDPHKMYDNSHTTLLNRTQKECGPTTWTIFWTYTEFPYSLVHRLLLVHWKPNIHLLVWKTEKVIGPRENLNDEWGSSKISGDKENSEADLPMMQFHELIPNSVLHFCRM